MGVKTVDKNTLVVVVSNRWIIANYCGNWFHSINYERSYDWYNSHYIDVIMTTMASQITSLTMVYSTVYSDADQKKTSKFRVTGLCVGNSPGPVNSPHKGLVTRKMFPFGDVIIQTECVHMCIIEDHICTIIKKETSPLCTWRLPGLPPRCPIFKSLHYISFEDRT